MVYATNFTFHWAWWYLGPPIHWHRSFLVCKSHHTTFDYCPPTFWNVSEKVLGYDWTSIVLEWFQRWRTVAVDVVPICNCTAPGVPRLSSSFKNKKHNPVTSQHFSILTRPSPQSVQHILSLRVSQCLSAYPADLTSLFLQLTNMTITNTTNGTFNITA